MYRWLLHFCFIFLMMLSSFSGSTEASELNMRHFSTIPIQHDGRIKPLESFARHVAYRLNNQKTIDDGPAINFLAKALFNPAETTTIPLFKITNLNVKRMLGLPLEKKAFSLAEIVPALQQQEKALQNILQKNENTWDSDEKKLVTLYDNASMLKGTITSLHVLLPLRIELPEDIRQELGIPYEDTQNFLNFKRHDEKLRTYLSELPEEKVSDQLQAFLFQLTVIEQNTDRQNLFRVMPPEWPLNQSPEWNSPWIAINMGVSGPKSSEYLSQWKTLADAYRTSNKEGWNTAAKSLLDGSLSFKNIGATKSKLSLEKTYLTLTPYFYSVLFYIAALMISLAIVRTPELPLHIIAQFTLLTGGAFQLLAITMRIFILERPPVSTLYESVIFVSLICIAMALLLSLFRKEKALFLGLGSVSGILFYFVSSYFAKDGDTLQVLTAVLDTSFWLGTHVLIITIGYGLCVITALLAHYDLYAKAFNPRHKNNLFDITLKLALVSLLFTVTGTILGGIWADQSWGRFWGWDPKENGALLIVLWIVWMVHGKIAGQLKEVGFMVCASFLTIIVALAWFGVNLLNVGLHSYGFISGIAYGLLAFCLIETLIIAIPAILLYQRSAREA